MRLINHIFFNLQNLFVVISFLISLYALRYKDTPAYLKIFIGYTLVGFILLIPNFIANYLYKDIRPQMKNVLLISTIYHYSFLGIFIISFINGSKKSWIYIIAFLVLVLLLYSVFTEFSKGNRIVSFSISALGLLVLCLIYFYRLLKFPTNINLFSFPAFWIIIGVFLSMGIQLPFSATYNSFYGKVSFEKYTFFSGMILFSFIVFQVFIVKSYLCSIKNSKRLLSL